MTVGELIAELQLCNPELPVLCETDSVQGGAWPAGVVELRSYAETEFADFFGVGFGGPNRCALIKLHPDPLTDDDE